MRVSDTFSLMTTNTHIIRCYQYKQSVEFNIPCRLFDYE